MGRNKVRDSDRGESANVTLSDDPAEPAPRKRAWDRLLEGATLHKLEHGDVNAVLAEFRGMTPAERAELLEDMNEAIAAAASAKSVESVALRLARLVLTMGWI